LGCGVERPWISRTDPAAKIEEIGKDEVLVVKSKLSRLASCLKYQKASAREH
jgi:hypothetical protein